MQSLIAYGVSMYSRSQSLHSCKSNLSYNYKIISTPRVYQHLQVMKRSRSNSLDAAADCKPPTTKRKPGPSASAGHSKHWSMKLVSSMKSPEMVVQSDELTITIKDAYPKARHHYLVLPRKDIPTLRHLNASHLPLLKAMLANGRSLEEKLKADDSLLQFRHGYHASPSMNRLHMHTISQDFVSPCLKTKKHWNSFTSEFFVNAEEVISVLEANGEVKFDRVKYEEMLKLPLKCHVCHIILANMPKLKSHIEEHIKTK